jgi:Uma2 family endonuclease
MATANRLMTADEFLLFPEEKGMRQELIKGEVRTMPLPGGRHGKVAMEIGRLLSNHVKPLGLGDTYAAETGFLIERNPDTVRGADAAFVRRERLGLITNPDKHVPFAPDLAVEVISPGDTPSEVAEKTTAWLAAGALMVWNVHAKTRAVSVSRPRVEPVVLGEDHVLDGGDVVPGFRCRVGDLFA